MQGKYTPFDPEAQDSQHTVNTAFVAQSSTDICHQLQQQRDNFTQSLKVANEVLENCNQKAEGKRANFYMDSRYAFATLHIRRAIYRERGLLTAGGKEIKNKEEILQLLEQYGCLLNSSHILQGPPG